MLIDRIQHLIEDAGFVTPKRNRTRDRNRQLFRHEASDSPSGYSAPIQDSLRNQASQGIASRTSSKYANADSNVTPALSISASEKWPVRCTRNPVTVGASAAPRYPPKFLIDPSDAVY